MWLVLCKKGLSVRLRFALLEDLSIMVCKPLKSVVNSKHLLPWCLENPYDFTSRNTFLQCLTGIIPSGLLVGNLLHGADICGQNGEEPRHLPSDKHTNYELRSFLLFFFLPTLTFLLRGHFQSFRRCELSVHTQPLAAVRFSSPCLY